MEVNSSTQYRGFTIKRSKRGYRAYDRYGNLLDLQYCTSLERIKVLVNVVAEHRSSTVDEAAFIDHRRSR